MQHEKLTCPTKLEEVLKPFIAPGVILSVNTIKESACSTPTVESVELRRGDEFVVLTQTYGSLFARVKPTPKLIKKVRISADFNGVPVVKAFEADDTYEIGKFKRGLEDNSAFSNILQEDFEEAESA